MLNNILKWTDRDPASPNAVRPGRKAGTMMSPTQVYRDGAFALCIGTPGSYGILQTQPQMLMNALEFGLNVQEAIEAPRVRVYRDRLVDAESRMSAETREALLRGATRSTCSRTGRGWWAAGRGSCAMPSRAPSSPAPIRGATATRSRYSG